MMSNMLVLASCLQSFVHGCSQLLVSWFKDLNRFSSDVDTAGAVICYVVGHLRDDQEDVIKHMECPPPTKTLCFVTKWNKQTAQVENVFLRY